MITTIKFAKTKETAIIPSKGVENMGFDIYACFEEDHVIIEPNEVKLVPTGIATAFDEEYGLVIKERSSTGIKGMAVRAGVIDSGYRGEIFVAINNTYSEPIAIVKAGRITDVILDGCIIHLYEKAIAQAILLPVPTVEVEEYTYSELMQIGSVRGVDGFGSSGK